VSVPSVLQEPQRPLRLNLENQRKQARALLNSARAGDARALLRLAAPHPKHKAATAKWSLHHAQLAVARELGFKSWAKLKRHIEADNYRLRFALVGAANRALEMEVDRPLFVDPLARALAGKKGFALRREQSSTTWPPYASGPAPEQSILTRYFDDAMQNAVEQFSLTQIVLFGAGMDARAFRLRWPSNLVFFELDDAAVFDHKELVLRRRRAKPTCDRRVVRANFASAAWSAKLLAAGFDRRRPAAFLIPTHLVYFDAATVERVFRGLSEIACAESWLGVDFFSVDTIESPFMQPFQEKLGALGYPAWRFGVRHPEAFLAEHGWRAECTVLGAPDASYGRWRYGYTPRTVPDRGIPRNYLAVAHRMPDREEAR
jgi:methyltransferase (TIGR00027 family)